MLASDMTQVANTKAHTINEIYKVIKVNNAIKEVRFILENKKKGLIPLIPLETS